MLLTIHNLPLHVHYKEVKELLISKCGLGELILDNLVHDNSGSMKVTVGVEEEEDAALLVRKINGLYFKGQQLFVQNRRQKKDIEQPYHSTQPTFQPSHGFNCNTLVQYPVPGLYQPMSSIALLYAPQSAGQTVQNPFMPFGKPIKMSSPAPVPHPSSNMESHTQQYIQLPQKPSESWKTNINDYPAPSYLKGGQSTSNRERSSRWNREGRDHSSSSNYQDSRVSRPERGHAEGFNQKRSEKYTPPFSQSNYSAWINPKPQDTSSFGQSDYSDRNNPKPQGSSSFGQNDYSDRNNPKPQGSSSFGQNDYSDRNNPKPQGSSSFGQNDYSDRNNPKPQGSLSFGQNDYSDRNNPKPQGSFSFGQNDYSDRNNPKPQGSSSFGQNDYSRNTNPQHTSSFGRNNYSGWDNPKPQITRPKFKQGPSTSGNNTRNWNDEKKPFVCPALNQNEIPKKRRFEDQDQKLQKYQKKPKTQPSTSQLPSRSHFDDYDDKFGKPNAMQKWKGSPFPPEQNKKRMFNVCFFRGVNKIMFTILTKMKNLNLDLNEKVLGKEYVLGVKKLMRREIMDRVYKLLGCYEIITENDALKRYRNLFSEEQDIQMYKNTRKLVDSAINSGNPSAWAQIMRPQEEIEAMNNMTNRKIKKIKQREMKFQNDLLKISQFRPQPQGAQQFKIPPHPNGDLKLKKSNKKELEQELETLEPFKVNPLVDKALDEEIEILAEFLKIGFETPENEKTRAVYASVDQVDCIDHTKKFLKYCLSKRISNKGVKLLRIYGTPYLPKRPILEDFLLKYNCVALSRSKSNSDKPFFIATFNDFKMTDKLVAMDRVMLGPPDNSVCVEFKYLHMAPKIMKLKYARIQALRRERINSLIEVSNVNLLDKDWQAQVEDAGKGHKTRSVQQEDMDFSEDLKHDEVNNPTVNLSQGGEISKVTAKVKAEKIKPGDVTVKKEKDNSAEETEKNDKSNLAYLTVKHETIESADGSVADEKSNSGDGTVESEENDSADVTVYNIEITIKGEKNKPREELPDETDDVHTSDQNDAMNTSFESATTEKIGENDSCEQDFLNEFHIVDEVKGSDNDDINDNISDNEPEADVIDWDENGEGWDDGGVDDVGKTGDGNGDEEDDDDDDGDDENMESGQVNAADIDFDDIDEDDLEDY